MAAVAFTRDVSFQFSSADVEFNSLTLNGAERAPNPATTLVAIAPLASIATNGFAIGHCDHVSAPVSVPSSFSVSSPCCSVPKDADEALVGVDSANVPELMSPGAIVGRYTPFAASHSTTVRWPSPLLPNAKSFASAAASSKCSASSLTIALVSDGGGGAHPCTGRVNRSAGTSCVLVFVGVVHFKLQ